MRPFRCVLLGTCLLASASAAWAQQPPFTLELRDGSASLKADGVPLRAILNEWARVGGTRLVGAERVPPTPVTIELTRVPERQALEILLRNVSGYLLGLRPAGSPGVSLYNRILIMPPSTAPRVPAVVAGAGPRQPQPPPQAPPPQEAQEPENVPDVVLEGPPGQVRPGTTVRMPTVSGQNAAPVTALPVPEPAAPASAPTRPGVVVTPGNPFGVPAGSSALPGVVTPVPQQTEGARQPQQPD